MHEVVDAKKMTLARESCFSIENRLEFVKNVIRLVCGDQSLDRPLVAAHFQYVVHDSEVTFVVFRAKHDDHLRRAAPREFDRLFEDRQRQVEPIDAVLRLCMREHDRVVQKHVRTVIHRLRDDRVEIFFENASRANERLAREVNRIHPIHFLFDNRNPIESQYLKQARTFLVLDLEFERRVLQTADDVFLQIG